MRFLLFILVLWFSLPRHFLAAPLNPSNGNERTTNEGYVFHNVYNSGLSTSQAQEILERLKAVEQKLNKVDWKGPSKERCPPGWKLFNGSCFFAFIKPMATWSEARYVCKSLGGDLVKITSAAENTFTYGLISGHLPTLTHVWIGLHRGGDKNFYWEDGDSVGYSNWDKGEPGQSAEKCAVFYSGQSAPSKWHDTSCNNKWGYICKMAHMI